MQQLFIFKSSKERKKILILNFFPQEIDKEIAVLISSWISFIKKFFRSIEFLTTSKVFFPLSVRLKTFFLPLDDDLTNPSRSNEYRVAYTVPGLSRMP